MLSPPPNSTRLCVLSLAIFSLAAAPASASQYSAARSTTFAHAERLREALEGRPEQQRTRLQYDRVLDAYRAIYHSDPASPKAGMNSSAINIPRAATASAHC
jgi:N-acetylmuramoyl-L-alanine amidase